MLFLSKNLLASFSLYLIAFFLTIMTDIKQSNSSFFFILKAPLTVVSLVISYTESRRPHVFVFHSSMSKHVLIDLDFSLENLMYFWIFAPIYALESLTLYKLPYVMVDPAMPDFVMKSHLSKVSQRLGSEKIMNIKKSFQCF